MPSLARSWISGSRASRSTARAARPADKASSPATGTCFTRQRDLGGGRLSLMMMNSLEPATFPGRGLARALPDGGGVPRQAPRRSAASARLLHEPVGDLPRAVGERSAVWLQLAPVGEPALGPTAFMHRASAGENPTAPLGHHWQDSTHIAFDVITAGWGWKALSLEASVFHGARARRTPLEHRGAARSTRSRGVLRAALRRRLVGPGLVRLSRRTPRRPSRADVRRVDGLRPLRRRRRPAVRGEPRLGPERRGAGDERRVAARRRLAGDALATRSTRAPNTSRRTTTCSPSRASRTCRRRNEPRLANVFAFTAGYLRDFALVKALATGLGADADRYSFPSSLKPAYGDFPVAGHFFLRLRWGVGAPHGSAASHSEHD